MSSTSSPARRARRASRPSASSRELGDAVGVEGQLGAALGDRGEVAHPGAEQRQARGRASRSAPGARRACAASSASRARRRAAWPAALGGLAPRPRRRAARTAAAAALAGRVGGARRAPPRARPRARRVRTAGDQLLDRRAQRAPLVVEQKAGPRRRRRRRAGPRAVRSGAGRQLGEPRLDRVRAEPVEADLAAARAHRLQQRLGLGADQDQVGERRRLLERLQQRVLALLGHRVGGLDHEHAPLALERAVGDLRRSPARGRPRPGAGCRAGAARRGRDAARGRRARGGARRRGRARPSASSSAASARAAARLAGAGRAGEQVGVEGRGARRRRARRGPPAGRRSRSRSSRDLGDRAHRRASTAAMIRAWTSRRLAGAVDHRDPLRVALGELVVGGGDLRAGTRCPRPRSGRRRRPSRAAGAAPGRPAAAASGRARSRRPRASFSCSTSSTPSPRATPW